MQPSATDLMEFTDLDSREAVKEGLEHLKAVIESNNTFTEEEFLEFKPMFQKDNGLSTDELLALRNKFFKRVDKYTRVVIKFNDGTEQILPPMFVRRPTSKDPRTAMLIDAFTNVKDRRSSRGRALQKALLVHLANEKLDNSKEKDEALAILKEFNLIKSGTEDDVVKAASTEREDEEVDVDNLFQW